MSEEKSSKRPVLVHSGVSEPVLVGLVFNTAPFLFSDRTRLEDPHFSYLKVLQDAKARVDGLVPQEAPDLWTYFQLNIASHFATVGTFIPTDVDLAIRQKLWKTVHHEATFLPMWKMVQEFHDWDESLVSKRFVITKTGRKLSGHQGEWFTIAMGAYATAQRVAKEMIPEVREAIEAEFKNQELALTELKAEFEEENNVESAKRFMAGVAAVAHNLGDLDRMFDLLEIDEVDMLKRRVFRAGHSDARNPKPIFMLAGKIYNAILAPENHRHFALRVPKGLRSDSDFLIPFGPFFDAWGENLIQNAGEGKKLNEGGLRDIAEALILGWKKLNPVSIYLVQGYARALYGMAKGLGGGDAKSGRRHLENLLSPDLKRDLLEGGLRTLMNVTKSEFEKKWTSRLRTELASVNENIDDGNRGI